MINHGDGKDYCFYIELTFTICL